MSEESKEQKEKKDIKVVTGDGKELNISPVYDHIKIDKPDNGDKNTEKVVIPKSSKK